MEDVVKALKDWSDYKKTHARGSFEDFCRYYLATHKKGPRWPHGEKQLTSPQRPLRPTETDAMFMMAVSRSTLAFWVYMRIALRDTPLPSIEDIMFCSALYQLGESRKTDVINHAMMEISTGTDILNRLIKKGFIHQRTDPNDKRSRLLTLTPNGSNALKKCFVKAGMAREIFLADLTDDDKKLVASILDPVQEKHSTLAIASKGKTIEEIYAQAIGK